MANGKLTFNCEGHELETASSTTSINTGDETNMIHRT